MVSWRYPEDFAARPPNGGLRAKLPAEWSVPPTRTQRAGRGRDRCRQQPQKDEVAMLLGHIDRLTDTVAKMLEAEG
jgi:hypothetical protein